MDTIQEFIDELNGYRKELAQPYLTDVTITENMVKDAYYRTTHPIHASHILFNIPADADPADTLKAYNKAIEIRNMFLNGEKAFPELAAEYSDDRSATQNKGDLGYFAAFNMVTPFENAAYNTPAGEVSMPVRSQFGYHLIYVHDISESKGKVKVAHIMKIFPDINNIDPEMDKRFEQESDSIYNELLNGADFAEMVKNHSDDQSTVPTNGEMQYIDQTFRVYEFRDAAFELNKIGDIHKPIRTVYGWHILKLINKQEPQTFKELEDELTQKVKNDPNRSKHSKQIFLNKLKKEYGLTVHEENIAQLKNAIDNASDTIKQFDNQLTNVALYTVNGKNFTVGEFYSYLKTKPNTKKGISPAIAKNELEKFDETVIIQYEDSRLKDKYPEFASIMQEYHDGMLLFAIMQEEVWDKAVKDSTGLENYYNNNRKQYFWDKHFDGLLIKCNTTDAAEYCKELLSENITDAETLYEKFNEKPDFTINIASSKWEKGDNPTIDYLYFDGDKPKNLNTDTNVAHGTIVEAGKAKTLNDARGIYISDYQNYLEQEWLKSLKNKYKIKVNKRLLKKVETL
jgi:peptidyl-prolyl cis-trans isomerase SurA